MFDRVIRDRMEVIGRFVGQGSVLDLGCVDARTQREGSTVRVDRIANALHRRIAERNPDTLGADIDAEGVAALNALGFPAVCADAETMDLGRRFDTIVAGEIVEHLENPGLFLRNLRRHLTPDGRLILSTPNPFYAAQTWKIWRHGRPAVHEDHAGWQDPTTMRQLLHRTGFELVEGYWVQPPRGFLKSMRSWNRFFRPYFAHSFLVVARPAAEPAAAAA